MASDILIVDDEADIRDLVAGILEDEGFSTRTARDSDSALTEIGSRRPHLVFLDIWLQGSKLDGLQLLEQIKKDNADLPVVMISCETRLTRLLGMAKPTPELLLLWLKICEFTPMTSPLRLSSGPPLLPGLMAASV